MSKLLVVDDEQSICWGLRRLGESMGHKVNTASSAEQALELIADDAPDAIVLDVRLPGMDGLAAIPKIRKCIGDVPIIVITAYGDLETAVETVRNGAFDYIIKPFDVDTVERVIARALARSTSLDSHLPRSRQVDGIVGSSAELQEVFKQIALAAVSDAGVLLCGESGTGKELVARAIHKYSARADGPFVAVNVASLSSTLAESELFGHARGAFTGADHDRAGFLVQADGGTLFLDEVADIPLSTQVKLLRALEHGEILPVGSRQTVRTDFRVISATHQNLAKKMAQGDFRHDLFFRLGAFRIDLPPLRERRRDIRELAVYFLDKLHPHDAPPPSLSRAAIEELERRPWFGNVRELRNAMEHAMIASRGGVIEPDHLPQPAAAPMFDMQGKDQADDASIAAQIRRWAETKIADGAQDGQLYEQLLNLVEPPLFRAAMEKCGGQYSLAARHLGIHRTTLKKKLDHYGIGPD